MLCPPICCQGLLATQVGPWASERGYLRTDREPLFSTDATKILLAGDLLLPSSPAIASLFLDFVPQSQVLDQAMLLGERLAAEIQYSPWLSSKRNSLTRTPRKTTDSRGAKRNEYMNSRA